MKQENVETRRKRLFLKLLKVFWFSLGGIIALMAAFYFVAAHDVSNPNALGYLIWFVLSFEAFAIFIGITGFYLLVKLIILAIKRMGKKK